MARGGPDAAGGARRCGGGEKEPPDKTISSAQLSCLPALLPINLSAQHWLAGCNLCLSQVRRRVRRVRVRSCKWLRGPSRALVRRKTHLFFRCHVILRMIILPRQARDTHRESTGKRRRFVQVRRCCGSSAARSIHPRVLFCTAQHSTAQHSTAQHNASSSCGIAMMTNHHVIIMTSS